MRTPLAADAIVVGAGPAGAATALLLARAGHEVLLLDRATFPRPKPCGDCLSAGSSAILHRLGVLDRVRLLPHARLAGWRISAPDGSAFMGSIARPPGHALAIEREVLDAALVAAAVAAGARLEERVRVTDLMRDAAGSVCGVHTTRGTLTARLVVGADGLRSVVARRLGAISRLPRLRKLSLTLHIDGPLPDGEWIGAAARAPDRGPVGEMHVGDGICVGVAPVRAGGGRCNLTVVADAGRFGRAVAADPRGFMRAACAAMPRLRDRVPDDATTTGALLTSGPFDRPVRTTVFDGAALAGDAAGYYDPFTGQGVCHALLSAELLARTADGALQRDDCSAVALRPYERALRRTLRTARVTQRAVETLLARPQTASRVIARLGRAGRAADAIIAVIGHTAPAAALLAPRTVADLLLADLVRTERWRN